MNPVYRAEIRHQGYVLRTNRSPTLWILLALVLLVPALIASGAFTVLVGVLGVRLPPIPMIPDIDTVGEAVYTIGAIALITMNLAHYLVVALVSSGLAVMSVQREQRNKTWDLLVLTKQNARAIALGKVGASLWVLRRDTAIVTMLRVGLVMLAVDLIRDLYAGSQFTLFDALYLTLWVVLWTVMDTVISVTAAIASALAPQWRPVMLPVALAVRGVTLFGGVFWLAGMINRMLSELDRGGFVMHGLVGLAVLAGLVFTSLRVVEAAARLAHASPHRISRGTSQDRPPSMDPEPRNIPTLSQGEAH